MSISPGARLGPYEIVSAIGAGGMGEVWKARDTKLDRNVAVKVLPQSIAADPDTLARFEREAKAVAALSHPNILAIHDFGNQDGIAYAVMELLEGETLRARLDDGPITHRQAVEYALQLARGLSAAHDKGIVHRDLKPENLFITGDGHLKILDFGLAKRVEPIAPGKETSAPTGSGHTQPGTVMGTVGYMSPEQVRGFPVDHRSDIFSFGTILYELLSGKKAFKRDTNAETMAAIMRDEPPELSESGRNISPTLDRIVKYCLEKDRESRFQSARDIAFSLSDQLPPAAPGTESGTDSGQVRAEEGFWIAVLPFKSSSSSAEATALAEGLTEDIVIGLSRFSYLRVIARGSASRQTTEGEAVDVRMAGKALGARYVIEGSLRQAGTKLRVAVQLLDASSGAHLWAESYERSFRPDAVFELEDELAPRIVATVADLNGVLVGSMAAAVRSRAPKQQSPYEAVLRSFGNSGRATPEDLAVARSDLELAVQKAPANADAWAALAVLCVQDYAQGFDVKPDSLASGLNAAQRAVEAAPSNSLAHFSLAQALFFQREIQSFRNEAERAAALNPMDATAMAILGELLSYVGDRERGLELSARAKQLNTHHPGWYWYADFYDAYRRGDDRGALDVALKVNLPGHWFSPAAIAAACGQLGERDAANKASRDLLKLRPDFGATVTGVIEKWWEPEYVKRLMDGWRKAGLDIPEPEHSA